MNAQGVKGKGRRVIEFAPPRQLHRSAALIFMIGLYHSDSVDPAFAALVDQAVGSIVLATRPAEVYATEIDGWFDYKWQGFSGTVMHESLRSGVTN